MDQNQNPSIDVKEIFKLANSLGKPELDLVEKSFNFAREVHKDQKRLSGEPYFNHLFATAKYLAELGMDGATISAGLLHDSIEDVNILPEVIEENFGKEVRFMVEGVTKLGHLRYHGSDKHNESLRKLFVAISEDIRVLMVKLCDRLHNMDTLQFVPEEKRLRIAKETLEIYVPIAYRLGIRKLSRKLEDLAFPFVYPEEYKEIKKLIKERYDDQGESLEKFRKSVTKELAKSGLTKFKTEYRVKGIYSLYKKYIKYKKDIDKIYDIAAIRILLEQVDDCYKALGIIHNNWRPFPGRIKDFIAFPKSNGYQGIHTTVFTGEGNIVEVQIKTTKMQRNSEYGIASHMNYKEDGKKDRVNQSLEWIKKILPSTYFQNSTERKEFKGIPEWIKDMVEYNNSVKNEDEAINDIKNDFFNEQIFVFTPKGDVVDLPKGSTPIDFGYTIHSDIGEHISGAKINGKMSSIESELKNGDIIEIITSKNARPNRKWLENVKTTFAKKHIRGFLQGISGK
jgi:GTP pyrophosphokinase